MLHVHAFNAAPLLRSVVDSYLIISADIPESKFIENHFLPHVNQNLVLSLDAGNTVYDCMMKNNCPNHYIAGSRDSIFRVRLYAGLNKMVIKFKPGGFYKVFQLSTALLSNRNLDAVKILGKEFFFLTRQIRNSPLSEKINLMDRWLINQYNKRKKSDRSIDEAIRLIESSKGNISIRELEEATFTTKRTLERHFLEQVGMYPKVFSRLIRFTHAIRFMELNLSIKWRQLAEVCGYYDQSHFIHEFKSITGGLPNDYISAKAAFDWFRQT